MVREEFPMREKILDETKLQQLNEIEKSHECRMNRFLNESSKCKRRWNWCQTAWLRISFKHGFKHCAESHDFREITLFNFYDLIWVSSRFSSQWALTSRFIDFVVSFTNINILPSNDVQAHNEVLRNCSHIFLILTPHFKYQLDLEAFASSK